MVWEMNPVFAIFHPKGVLLAAERAGHRCPHPMSMGFHETIMAGRYM